MTFSEAFTVQALWTEEYFCLVQQHSEILLQWVSNTVTHRWEIKATSHGAWH